jgi:hypothetical protein
LELLSVFLQPAFAVFPPTRFFQQSQGSCRVIRNGFQVLILKIRLVHKWSRDLLPLTIQHILDDLV